MSTPVVKRICEALDGVVAALRAAGSPAARAAALERLAGCLKALTNEGNISGAQLSVNERAALSSKFAQLGELLAAADRDALRLLARRNSAAAVRLVTFASYLLVDATFIAGSTLSFWQGDDLQRFLKAAALLTSSGSTMLAGALTPAVPSSAMRILLHAQLMAAEPLLTILENAAACWPGLAASIWQPESTVRWLTGCTRQLALFTGGTAATDYLTQRMLSAHASVCDSLLSKGTNLSLNAVCACVQADASLQRALVEQLVRSAAMGAGTFCGSRASPASQYATLQASLLVFSLEALGVSTCLQAALRQNLQQPGARLWQLVSVLAARLPVERAQAVDADDAHNAHLPHLKVWTAVCYFLQLGCNALGGQEQEAAATAAAAARFWAAIEFFPRLTAAWRAVVNSIGVNDINEGHVLAFSDSLSKLMESVGEEVEHAGSQAAVSSLTNACIMFQFFCCIWADGFAAAVPAAGAAELCQPLTRLSSLLPAAQRLHLSSCRLIHWATAAASFQSPAKLGPLTTAFSSLMSSFILLECLQSMGGQPGQSAPPDTCMLQAHCAAQWMAIQQIIAGAEQGQLLLSHTEDTSTFLRISNLILLGLAPLATDPAQLQVYHQSFQATIAAGFSVRTCALELVTEGSQTPHSAVALLTSGVLSELLSQPDVQALAGAEASDLRAALVELLQTICSEAARVSKAQQQQLAGAAAAAATAAGTASGAGAAGAAAAVDVERLDTGELEAGLALLRRLASQASGGGELPLADFIASAHAQTLPAASALAAQLQTYWRQPEQLAAAELVLARAAAGTRACANLRCANLGGEGREAEGRLNRVCAGCRAVRYCCRECSVVDWRAGHKRVCKLLVAEAAAAAAAAAGDGNGGGGGGGDEEEVGGQPQPSSEPPQVPASSLPPLPTPVCALP